ncbi:fibrobacter succinogenes major paralogous domain-containing protein [Fibrobacter sp.]|uniref:fibrobacter succinogenes major paralogous domain-containing protein n=1 Tax=Fibrobacter sp. TaxID=35828 RepID=UPI00261E260E|nr:fibrobacter succinogenes major paralogous domain-containing protein [Fibrobacter sp.]MDD5943550.1 fibrobacter succinogenes major paralogous domain-containing protein [Fibrobacter sp.]
MNTIQKNLFATVAFVLWGLCACSGDGDGENPQSSSAAVKANWSYLSVWADYREMTDPRDGQVYKMVKIGSFVVMAENLNYDMPSSYCYDNLPDNCGLYGRLYTWEAAIQACPAGWHLPSSDEWEALYAEMGRTPSAMQAKGFPEWSDATDAYGFSALPAGRYDHFYGARFRNVGERAYFWSATAYSSNVLYYWFLDASVAGGNSDNKGCGYSVRCLQDL